MARVFFTSDLHFGHDSLCNSVRNMTADESYDLIRHNWNKVVTKRDLVYVLGDITMEKHQHIEAFLSGLNGQICIIGGNHDYKRCCKEYQRLGIPVMGVLEYKGFMCTHIPIHPRELQFCRGNIHGHIHAKDTNSLNYVGDRYFNVNIELHNYTPVLFDDIEKYFINLK